MQSDLNSKHQKAVREWMDISDWNNPFAITLTLKKSCLSYLGDRPVRVRVNKYVASQNFRHFMALLNKKIFGNAPKRFDKKLSVFGVLEGGQTKHLHYHAVIDCPAHVTPFDFEQLIRSTWLETTWADVEMVIKNDADQGWIEYITKKKDKYSVTEAIDWTNVHKK